MKGSLRKDKPPWKYLEEMMNNILITSAGQRVSLVRIFRNEIQKINPGNKVYTVDLNPGLSPACQISDGFLKAPAVNSGDYINSLLKICKDLNIKLLIPTIDSELMTISENADIFMENGITPVVSSVRFVEKCRDKRLINSFFAEHLIDFPRPVDKNNPTFPLFIKPYDGSLSKDTFLITDSTQLNDYHLNNPKLMFMEYIDHKLHDEYTVDTYYDKNGELKCVVPRKRIFVRAGEVSKGVTKRNKIIAYIMERLRAIEGARGCLTMQFFFNPQNERIIGIEINPRFGGGYPLSYLAGANYPKFLIDEYILDKKVPYFEDWEDNLLMLRYDDEVLVHGYEG